MNLTPKQPPGELARKSSALNKIRAAKPARPQAGSASAPAPARRPRLIFGLDATASREVTWDSAKRITDRMFDAIPGALDVALAVHGGNQVHTFTQFSADVAAFRRQAATVRCESGQTQMCALMARALDAGGVRVLSYIGDAFERVGRDSCKTQQKRP